MSRRSFSKPASLAEVKAIMTELLPLMGIENCQWKVETETECPMKVAIDHHDNGLLIGRDGETLMSLQLILRLMIYRRTGTWTPLLVNVGDYLERRQETLEKMAGNLAQKAKFTNAPQEINHLNAAERRTIHLFLKNHPDVATESIDTPGGRQLIIRPSGHAKSG